MEKNPGNGNESEGVPNYINTRIGKSKIITSNGDW